MPEEVYAHGQCDALATLARWQELDYPSPDACLQGLQRAMTSTLQVAEQRVRTPRMCDQPGAWEREVIYLQGYLSALAQRREEERR